MAAPKRTEVTTAEAHERKPDSREKREVENICNGPMKDMGQYPVGACIK